MACRLILSLCVLVVSFAASQDTSGLHNSVSKHDHLALSRLEQNLNHRMRELERRLLHKLHDNFNKHNVTAEIENVLNLFHFQHEEFSLFRENERLQQKEIAELRAQLTEHEGTISQQQAEIDSIRASLADVTSLSRDLHDKLDSFLRGQASDLAQPVTASKPKPIGRKYPADCEDVYLEEGMKYPGVYFLLIQPSLAPEPFQVACKITVDAGWSEIQRRQDGSVDFFRGWEDYKNGFGNLEGEFWLGLEHIYELTNQADYRLRIEMKTFDGDAYWAEYDHFRLSDESDNYRLHVHGYRGNAGDALTYKWSSHDGMQFSTKDRDHDARYYDNCAENYRGAWWFRSCFDSHLNGDYHVKGAHKNYFQRTGILWKTVHDHASMKEVSMMVRPNTELEEEEEDEGRVQKRNTNYIE